MLEGIRTSLLVLTTAVITLFAGCGESSSVTETASVPEGDALTVEFTAVTTSSGLGNFQHETGTSSEKWMPETMGSGCGFFDYNGDGWLDVLLVGGATWPEQGTDGVPALRLYRNNKDGTFTEVTEKVGLSSLRAYGFGVTMADYDNDGDEDIFFTALGKNHLIRNNGDGTFADVTAQAGLGEHDEWSTSALFFDADRDGHLDVYVGNYVDWSPENDLWCSLNGSDKAYCTPEMYEGVASRYYHNNGDGTFTDRTEEAGFLPAPGKTLGVAELDYNGDNWPDLVVANDMERNLLYENNGDGTFAEKGLVSGIAFDENGKARAGMGVDAGDVNNTGDATIFVGNLSHETIGVFRYRGNNLFVDRAAVSQIGHPSLLKLTFGLFLFDVDLDTDLDLFVANGHLQAQIERVEDAVTYRQRQQLFVNGADGIFHEAGHEIKGVFDEPLVARGAAYGDYDRDGDLDVLIVENGGGVHLWRNDTAGGNFLRVQLEGSSSNRGGIGSEVSVVLDGSRMRRRVRTGSSYLSQSEKVLTFGLGQAEKADSIVVRWPSGNIDRFGAVKANQQIHIAEDQD